MPHSGVHVDATPLCISGQVNVNMGERFVTIPVRRRLDLNAQIVALPFHVLKGLVAAIIDAEANAERAAINQAIRPAMQKAGAVEAPA